MNTSIENLTKFLRWAGGISMVVSAILFMMTGRYDMNSLTAHYIFLGLNTLLCALGITSSLYWKDQKTARTFLGLSLSIVPAQFAQLGGFIFSKIHGVSEHLPKALQLSLPDEMGLTVISTLSLIVLLPIIYLGFASLNKDHAKRMSLVYIVSSVLIIFPYRDVLMISVFILSCALMIFHTINRVKGLKTFEGRVSQLILLIPMMIIIARNLFYPFDLLFVSFLSSTLGLVTLFFVPTLFTRKNVKFVAQILSVIPFTMAIVAFLIAFKIPMAIFPLTFASLLYGLSFFAVKHSKEIRIYGSSFLPLALLFIFQGMTQLYQGVAVLLTLGTLVISIYNNEKVSFNITSATFVTFAIILIKRAIIFPEIGMWQLSAIASITLIISASFIEKKFSVIKSKTIDFYQRLN